MLCAVFISKDVVVFAQTGAFKYKAAVQKIDSNGVYKIELSADLIAKSRDDLKDIRLVDNSGKFVAYELSSHLKINTPDNFIEFPEVTQLSKTDSSTTYVAENKNKLNIDQLWIALKNTSVNRTVNIAGSDNLKEWFAIKEDISLQDASYGDKPEYQQSFIFPTSDYRYFKIQVNGKNKTPVKIIQAGIMIVHPYTSDFTALPSAIFDTKEKNKISHIHLYLNQPYQVDKLHFNIVGPKYYSRRIKVYTINKNGRAVNALEIADTIITSAGTQDVIMSAKAKDIRIDIYNEDDNPVHIAAVNPYQAKQYAICYLESNHNYDMVTGNPTATGPQYDLSFLRYRAFNLLPTVGHSAVINNQGFINSTPAIKRNFTPLLWAALLVVLLLLSFLTFKMIGEIKPKI